MVESWWACRTRTERKGEMARDLLLGRTNRSWAAGFSDVQHRTLAEDVLASRDVGKLGAEVAADFRQNFSKILTLSAAKKMPEGDRKAYAKVVRRWRDLEERRGGKYLGEDYVELASLRDANRRVAARLAEIETSDKSPAETTEKKVLRLAHINLAVGAAGLVAAVLLANKISPAKRVYDPRVYDPNVS